MAKQTTIEIPVSPERTISLTKEEAKVLQQELNEMFPAGVPNRVPDSMRVYGPQPFPNYGTKNQKYMVPDMPPITPEPVPSRTTSAPLPGPSHWIICGYENLNKDAPTQHGE